ncbi:MAG: DUF3419 family protein [Bacteroidales bacterium]|nr:DUF3419 family protein [Bacteroidales bacterium]
MKSGHLHKVSFDKIRYANCWEDADVLIEAINPKKDDVILSIGSAGDNCFTLLSESPASVIVYDISKVQLFLIELKKASFQALKYTEFLNFLGFINYDNREQVYQKHIRAIISSDARGYWDNNIQLIQKGIIFCGKFEKYFLSYRKWIQPLLASKSTINKFFSESADEKSIVKFKKRLSKPILKGLFSLFFGKHVMGAVGRSPRFYDEVQIDSSKYLLNKFSEFILRKDSYKNHYIHFIAKGYFSPVLPHYARKENFENIKNNLSILTLKQGYLDDGIEREKGITAINCSDIFEYMNVEQIKKFTNLLINKCDKGTRIVYWNLMVDRYLSDILPERLSYSKDISQILTEKDKLFFYKRFIHETII